MIYDRGFFDFFYGVNDSVIPYIYIENTSLTNR